jgi:hypothetical protein
VWCVARVALGDASDDCPIALLQRALATAGVSFLVQTPKVPNVFLFLKGGDMVPDAVSPCWG